MGLIIVHANGDGAQLQIYWVGDTNQALTAQSQVTVDMGNMTIKEIYYHPNGIEFDLDCGSAGIYWINAYVEQNGVFIINLTFKFLYNLG